MFLKQQIYVNQFVCSNYIKTFNFTNKEQNICECAKDIVQGANKQEVVSIPKELKKKGFFEKLFHFFKWKTVFSRNISCFLTLKKEHYKISMSALSQKTVNNSLSILDEWQN